MKGQKIHFICMGGIGMSALARLAHERGASVSGCDLRVNPIVRSLERLGCTFHLGHHPSHLKGVDLVVYSSAIPKDSPEMREAARLGIETISRSTFLSRLMADRKSVGIAGAHGKTTTTWMSANLLVHASLDPTVMVGGNVPSLKGNHRFGRGEWFVTEVDESDGLLLEIRPTVSIVTNIDKEHMDHYGTMAALERTFRQYVRNVAPGGALIACGDDARLMRVAKDARVRVWRYGLGAANEIRAERLDLTRQSGAFDLVVDGKRRGRITTHFPGEHNVRNALAVCALAEQLGIPLATLQKAMRACERVGRRMDLKGVKRRIKVFDDYGHHPTEIQATIAAIKHIPNGRLIVVFQPHRYTRTKLLLKDFGRCFQGADHVIVTSIYSANEPPIGGLTGMAVANEIALNQPELCANYIAHKECVPDYLKAVVRAGDTILLIGAGDIGSLAGEILKRL